MMRTTMGMGWAADGATSLRASASALRALAGIVVLTGWLTLPGAVAGQGYQQATGDGGAETERRREFQVTTLESGIDVDGRMTEPGWAAAVSIPLSWETNPGDNAPAPVATRCAVTYDETHLYLACQASDPDPTAIRAYVTDRDDIQQHDRIVFTLDPFNDARRAFQFGVSALGVQSDAVFDPSREEDGPGNGGPVDFSWDAIWSSAGVITESGYSVEAAIPFKSLRFPSSDDVQSWGFFASRQWPRSENVEIRSMVLDQGNSCELCQANLLTGFRDIAPGTNLEFTPTFTGARTDEASGFPRGELETGDLDGEFGLDGRWGITPNMTLNATINPDFSQVEADVAQFDINNRFALFFPEKRPFFLEGADFFSTPIQAVFTRSIADPSLGTKLTGKAGANAVGVLVARDEVNNLLIPGEQRSSTLVGDESVTTATGRFRRDVGRSSSVGVLATFREGENGYYNRVGGADAFVRILPSLTAQIQYLHTETRYAPEVAEARDQPRDAFGGDAGALRLRFNTRRWSGGLNAESRSGGFRADAGFVPQVDWRDIGAWVDRTFWAQDEAWYTSITWSGGFWHQENTDGRLLQEGLWTNLLYEGPLQSSVWLNPNLRREFFDGETHEMTTVWFGGSIRPWGSLGFRLSANYGGAVDFANSREGRRLQLNPSLDVRIGRKMDVRLTQSYQELNTVDGEDVFRASISQLRAVYNFTPRAFVRALLQYRNTTRNPDTWVAEVDRSSETLFTQLLFSYKVNPQSVVFVGYSDNRSGLVDTDFQEFDLARTDRSFFVKFGYAWRP